MNFTLGDTVLISSAQGEGKTYIEFYELLGTKAEVISIHKEKVFIKSLSTGQKLWVSEVCLKFNTNQIQIDLGDMYTTYIHVPDDIYERFINERPKITIKAV